MASFAMDNTLKFRTRNFLTRVYLYLPLVIVCIITLYPVVMMVLNSFKSDIEIVSNSARLPSVWTLQSYANIFRFNSGLWSNYLISVFISTTSTIIALVLCSMAAYGFSKYRFKGRNLLFSMLLAMLMVPAEITIPGKYLMFAYLDWLNTLQVQILPTITPMLGLFLMRQYMLDIPDEMIEAAKIDGAGHFAIYWQLMVPVCAPILGAFAILHFLATWNAYTWPSLVAMKSQVQPIMVILPQLMDPDRGFFRPWATIMAGCVLSTLPILTVFLLFQDTFMKSIVVGSTKG